MEALRITLIEDDAKLAEWAQLWLKQSVIGVDTEFVRTQTFYPEAGLIQISCDEGEVLIDPLRISDFEPLRRVFSASDIVKVLHSCTEDMEVFQRLLGVLPQPLFDTQIAGAFLGLGLSIGFQRLVETMLQAELPASETRSNWLQRPLTESQLVYASADVHYLLPIYATMFEQLQQKGLLEAVREECANLVADYEAGRDPSLYFLKLRGAWRLSRTKQQVLQALCVWREEVARERNLPRSHVISDPVLIEIAQNVPKTLYELSQVEGITHRQLKQDAEALLDNVRLAQDANAVELTELIPRPLAKNRKDLFQRLRDKVRTIAESRELPESLLVKKNLLEKLASSVQLDRPHEQLAIKLDGWRAALLAAPLLTELNAFIDERKHDAPDLDIQEST